MGLKNLKLFSLLILVGVSCFYVGRSSQGQVTQAQLENENYREKFEALKARFDELNRVDIEEYLQLKDQKEKYQKADEILGKVLTIFLANLGLVVSEKRVESIKGHLNPNGPRASDHPAQGSSESSGTRDFAERGRTEIRPSLEEGPEKKWSQNEASVDKVYSDHQVKDFLDSVEVKDLFSEVRIAKQVSQKQLDQIEGLFFGRVLFDDQSKTAWDVEMELDASLKNGALNGTSLVALSKNGEVFSRSSGSGGVKGFRSFAGSERAILVKANGEDGFFQLYFVPKLNKFIGNYYHAQSAGNFKRTGRVTLEKR